MMRKSRSAWKYGLAGVGLVLAMAAATAVAMPSYFASSFPFRSTPSHFLTSPVRRIDLNVTLTTGGRVDSYEKTIVECGIENVDVRVRGNSTSVGGASAILNVVPDGSIVKKGDVLCELDASTYVELVRVQQMNVDRARSDYRQAELSLEVAKVAVDQYREGIMAETVKRLRGQIALAESDQRRAADRLEWTRKMVQKGYISLSQVKSEEFALARIDLSLRQGRTSLEMFERFSAPKNLKVLTSNIMSAEAVQNYQLRRLQRFEERLDYYKKQVENCTIRAPHDGFVIYYNEENRNVRIEPGLVVRERQKLFYLPDLARMEVEAILHESVMKEVQPGMRAKVRVEGLPDRVIEGHLEAVSQLPTQHWFSDVRYFVGTVKLDNVPKGLKPGMSAEVELVTAFRPDVLVVPADALTVDQGHNVCYVAREDGFERREVKLGKASRDLLEVTEGLEEGENVVLEPAAIMPHLEVVEGPAPDAAVHASVEHTPRETAGLGL